MNPENTHLPSDCNRKTGVREALTLLCEVRQGTRAWTSARLEDISQSGFRIAWHPGVSRDRPLRIRIPGLQMLTAHVRWMHDHQVGCEFEAPLHVAVFEHIVRQARLEI